MPTQRYSESEPSLLEYRALAELRSQLRRFLRFSEDTARSAGIEPQQHQLLLALKALPDDQEPAIGALAAQLLVKHHTAVELVDRLEENDLVTRTKSVNDQRRVLVTLTARGRRLLKKLSLAHKDELRSAGPVLVQALNAILSASARATAPATARARTTPRTAVRARTAARSGARS
jgi:DNA-binding MarR family transcriptional regulator